MSTNINNPWKMASPTARVRKTQERTGITRTKLIDAAAQLFTEHGFEGVSIRDLENTAEVQRGLLKYHFSDKETLWKAMADRTFMQMEEATSLRLEVFGDLSPRERVAGIIRFYVKFCSEHPELPRLLAQEARHDSWRIRYLVSEHIDGVANALREPVMAALGLSSTQFVHWYYILAGGSSLIFSHAPECKLLFGVDAHRDDAVAAHAEMMVKTLLGNGAQDHG